MADQRIKQLECYLDGLLNGEELAHFERALAIDAELKAAVELQRQIDASLIRLFSAPSQAAPLAVVKRAAEIRRSMQRKALAQPRITAPPPNEPLPLALRAPLGYRPAQPRQPVPWRLIGYAAAIMIMLLGAFAAWMVIGNALGPGQTGTQPPADMVATTTPEALYQRLIRNGFEPNWVCKDDNEFSATFQRRFGQPLLIKPPPSGASWLGLDYCNCLSAHTLALLVRSDDTPIVVLIDRLTADKPLSASPQSELHLFRREVGQLVLYEVSPLDQPRAIGSFYKP